MGRLFIVTVLMIGLVNFVPEAKQRIQTYTYKKILSYILVIYACGYLYFTFLSREANYRGGKNLVLLRAFRQTFFVDFDLVKTFRELLTGRLSRIIMKMEALEGVWLNGLLFFPLGYLVPEMGAQRGLNARILSVLFLGIFVSAWTECLQFATGLGCFDVDDLIYNTAGCMAGIWTWRRQRKKGVL